MMALYVCMVAACCGALSNLFFRMNSLRSSGKNSANAYLFIYYLVSFLLSILNPEIWRAQLNWTIILFGVATGLLNVFVMLLTSAALKKGPPGLTFAFQNASSVFPGFLLFLLFGAQFGFSFEPKHALGLLLVPLGLFLGSKGETSSNPVSIRWLKPAIGCCLVQILTFMVIQGRCILFACNTMGPEYSPYAVLESEDVWFLPAQFGTALFLQFFVLLKEKGWPQKGEALFGGLAGMANFTNTFLLLYATKIALPFEKVILFPCFAVATIFLCNIWANRFYKEKFNVKANALLTLGIFLSLT